MDYCYACRRHLNGAYSCPGCGTPADRLTLPPVTETATLPPVRDDEDGGDTAFGGRAARRTEGRRTASRRARRGRQRVAVYGVGLVAVLGALTMFSMAALSGGSGGGAGPGTGVNPVLPGAPTGAVSPDDAGLFPSSPGGAPGHPRSTSPSSSASPSGSTSPTPSTSAPHTSAPATTAPPVTAPATGTPTPTPTQTHPPSNPTPTRTPCKRVLWWCQ
jgi:cell division septation protein DedD